jgi:hypothetical protein
MGCPRCGALSPDAAVVPAGTTFSVDSAAEVLHGRLVNLRRITS